MQCLSTHESFVSHELDTQRPLHSQIQLVCPPSASPDRYSRHKPGTRNRSCGNLRLASRAGQGDANAKRLLVRYLVTGASRMVSRALRKQLLDTQFHIRSHRKSSFNNRSCKHLLIGGLPVDLAMNPALVWARRHRREEHLRERDLLLHYHHRH